MNRILVEAESLRAGRVVLTDGRFIHIRDVLASHVGDRIRMGVVDGPSYWGRVVEMDPEHCVVEWVEAQPSLAEPQVDLLLAIPRPKCLRRLLPQLAALGIRRLYLSSAEKVDRSYWGSHLLEPETYRPLLIEGLMQAGDTRLPEVRLIRRLRPFLEDEVGTLYSKTARWVAHPGATESVDTTASTPGIRLLAVGPEGGWSAFEMELFERCGFQCLSLGRRILRTDTACVALLTRMGAME